MILCGDTRELLDALDPLSIQTIVTSPPYWGLRDYGVEGQIGLEPTPNAYVETMVRVFRSIRRALKDDGTVWLNLGDTYAGSRSYQVPDNKHRDVGNFRGICLGSSRADGQVKDSSPRNRDGALCPEGCKPKDLIGIPWRVALALQADGWYLRSDIIWQKPNPMPESVTDRPTRAHEYLFLLTKSAKYYYDAEAGKEPVQSEKGNARTFRGGGGYTQGRSFNNGRNEQSGDPRKVGFNGRWRDSHGNSKNIEKTRNLRDVWLVAPQPYKGAHFAVMPEALVEPCVLIGSKPGDVVLDPFAGAGTVGVVCKKHNREFWGIELNPEYIALAEDRIARA